MIEREKRDRQKTLDVLLAEAEECIYREVDMAAVLLQCREAFAEQIAADLRYCCPINNEGDPDESQMAEASRPMIEETWALIAKIDAVLARAKIYRGEA